MNIEVLHTPVQMLKGVSEDRAKLLYSELGISTYQDLLNLYPYRYVDKTKYYKINELTVSSTEFQIIGKIIHIKTVLNEKGRKKERLVATFTDGTSQMELVWFTSTSWFRNNLKVNEPYVIFGKVNRYGATFSMPHPEMELLSEHQKTKHLSILPVYPSTEKLTKKGITTRVLRQWIYQILKSVGVQVFYETLPEWICTQLKLMSKSEAIYHIHFPTSQQMLQRARFRLKFEELFYIQIQLVRKNAQHKLKIKGIKMDRIGAYFTDFYNHHLPFELTNAQKRVIREIRRDMNTSSQMNRLLQGDVGSGKTIVALMSMLIAIDNGYQACLMAPTEILATQHYQAIQSLVKDMGINVELLVGSTKVSTRKRIDEQLRSGELHILVGTHAILEDKVVFNNLGIAIIDEQHRFGVAQRSKLWTKNNIAPHILVMTATPIPRTLAMSFYGDLDISVIDELPPGRKPIQTVHYFENSRDKAYSLVLSELKKGHQAYVVYPLIEESETLDLQSLEQGYQYISSVFEPNYKVSMVHGRMKPQEKDEQMRLFVDGKTHIMVATTVIEVGVNVPNASVMVIESAERFGLSQLHQLRGRVGRGAEQSYCVLLTGNKLSNDTRERIQTMVSTCDGFEISEVDLKLRGPGDLMGTQQSGILKLRIADIVKDNAILKQARTMAQTVVKSDAMLQYPEHQMIVYTLQQLKKYNNIWAYIS